MTAYYNENDPYAAEWLRNLIAAGHIAPGDVDERSIEDVTANDLRGYTQCHFFAGIGVWSYALRQAGWPDDREVWTGSCPCQPFSTAGKRKGTADERHLWPHWHFLIEQRQPAVVFGEQVASKDGLAWLDLVQADLEGTHYASAAFDMCAAGIGAPHIRQRSWFVAYAESERRRKTWESGGRSEERTGDSGKPGWLADSDDAGSQGRDGGELQERTDQCAVGESCASGGLEQPGGGRRQWRQASTPRYNNDGQASERSEGEYGAGEPSSHRIHQYGAGPTNGLWGAADWLLCRDGKWRPVEPGTFPLADGAPSRVGRLRAYGNAIVAPLAQAFVSAAMEVLPGAVND